MPASLDALLALPGIGAYTAAAVASFAFGQRHPVLDTNVRRVLARLVSGQQLPPPSASAAERRLAEALLPEQPAVAARWSVAVMELGALVCTAARPRCARVPGGGRLRLAAGRAPGGWRRPAQPGLRGHRPAVPGPAAGRAPDGGRAGARRRWLDAAWAEPQQRSRALDSLVADGLVDPLPDGRFALPGTARPTGQRPTGSAVSSGEAHSVRAARRPAHAPGGRCTDRLAERGLDAGDARFSVPSREAGPARKH